MIYFTAHTINCMCHSIRAMFRVLGVYNFACCLEMVFCFQNCVRKNCSIDWEKLLKFKAEGREVAKFLQSPEQFIQASKGQNNFWYGMLF